MPITVPAQIPIATFAELKLYEAGNVIATNQNASPETRQVNNDNEYTQINGNSLQYDPEGNLISYTGRQYLYDWANRLIEAKLNCSLLHII